MASIRDLKKRITSVKNTQQTTRAMKLVSAAKLRRAQYAIVNNRPYARRIGELIRLVSSMADCPTDSPLIKGAPKPDSEKKVLLMLVTSDRGLCGGFNSSIIKRALSWQEENQSRFKSIDFGFVGRRGHDYFQHREIPSQYYVEFGRTVVFEQADTIVSWVIQEFTAGKYDSVYIIYNEFKNAMVQGVNVEPFLPVAAEEVQLSEKPKEKTYGESDLYLVKPSHKEVLDRLLQKHFAIQAYRILLESQASEHGARMVAMENATKNAKDMIRSLTLQFNKQRQAAITKELMEIVSGSESQKG